MYSCEPQNDNSGAIMMVYGTILNKVPGFELKSCHFDYYLWLL